MGTYIVTKDLVNVRNQPKLADSTLVGTVAKGTLLQLDDDTIVGDTPVGTTNNTWHADTLNRFVSSAAVIPADFPTKNAQFQQDPFNLKFLDPNNKSNRQNWRVSWGHVDLLIWRIWKEFGTQGEGVKVVVIDDGVWSDSNDLKGRIGLDSKSLLSNDTLVSSSPVHGTACAGLIGADGSTNQVVFGVAPACELVVLKGGTADTFAPGNINAALDQACQLKADIVSISRGMYVENPNFPKYIDQCVKQGILVFGAAADDGATDYSYPASTTGAFSVGAYMLDGSDNRQFNTISNHNDKVAFLAPGNQLLSTSQNATPYQFDATSAATAFAAGMFALIKGAVKDKVINTATLQQALQVSENTDPVKAAVSFNGCRIPNIFNLINYFRS